jgi:hypothetical protein
MILTLYPSLHASPYIQIYDAGMYDPLEKNKDVKSTDRINEIKQNKKCMGSQHSCKLKWLWISPLNKYSFFTYKRNFIKENTTILCSKSNTVRM